MTNSTTSLTKDGKVIEMPESIATLQRWGMWADGGGYADGRSIGEVDFGLDYRVMPNWLVGVGGRSDWGQGGHFAQGGVYSALSEKGVWLTAGGLFGPSSITAYGEVGYAFTFKQLLTGPAYAIQYDRFWTNTGFGTGDLLQNRVGWWAAYPIGRLIPQAEIMYQNASQDVDSRRNNALWFGIGAGLGLTQNISVYSFYSFEGNGSYQISQAQLGLRFQF